MLSGLEKSGEDVLIHHFTSREDSLYFGAQPHAETRQFNTAQRSRLTFKIKHYNRQDRHAGETRAHGRGTFDPMYDI